MSNDQPEHTMGERGWIRIAEATYVPKGSDLELPKVSIQDTGLDYFFTLIDEGEKRGQIDE